VKILIVEPYFTGSHASWATGYKAHSRHNIEFLKLSGAYWKWRMHGGAVTLARRFMGSDFAPDLIVATDMLDLTTFQALTRSRTASTPMAVYFHENQLTYPWSPTDRDVVHKRDQHYGFINYASAMAADAVYFNSNYHLESFFEGLDQLLKHFPDNNELGTLENLRSKSTVLGLGLDLRRFDEYAGGASFGASEDIGSPAEPLIVWNHRWEYDKNPDAFFKALRAAADGGRLFRLAVLGEKFHQVPVVFFKAQVALADRVVQFGYAEDFETYAHWLHSGDIIPVTSNQDFFGASVVEAVYCGCRPLLPRRLAYPELIPQEFSSDVFYDGDPDLAERLDEMLREPLGPVNDELRAAMLRFDWRVMAPQYDRLFEDLVRSVG
jgi:glycosyltransferase involved in cell wall biosynthesis